MVDVQIACSTQWAWRALVRTMVFLLITAANIFPHTLKFPIIDTLILERNRRFSSGKKIIGPDL